MTKRFLFSLFFFCLTVNVIHTELNVDGFCNPIYDSAQNPEVIGSKHTRKENPLQVIKAAPHYLILRFQLPALEIQKRLQNGKAATYIRFDGASWTTETEKPRLPIYTVQIGLPSFSSVTATVLEKQSAFKKVEPPLITNQAVDPLFPDAHERFNLTSETGVSSKTSTLYPAEMIEVVPVGFVRSQRVGALHIYPVQYNNTTQQLKITKDITFRIDFYGASTAAKAAIPTHSLDSSVYESMFQTMLINNTQAFPWRQKLDRLLQMPIRAAPAAPTSNRRRFKFPITRSDMYRISYNNLRSSGVTPETIDLDSIRVETSGHGQGFYIFDENQNETLDPADAIVFYARALSNKFTDTNVYWLTFVPKGTERVEDEPDTDEISRISTKSAAPVNLRTSTPNAFLTKLRFEKDVRYDPLDGSSVTAKSESADHYFWTAFRGDGSDISRKRISVSLPGAVSRFNIERDATLHVKLQGASYKSAAEHKARITFNDKPLGRVAEWRQQTDILITRDIPQKFIHHDVANYMLIEALDTNETPESDNDFYLDWYEFEYWHDFRAKNRRLAFSSKTDPVVSGKTNFKVTNFTTDAIDVYTLGHNGLTAKLLDGKVTRSGNTYHILFEDEVMPSKNYFVIANNAYSSISSLTEVPPSSLRSPAIQADYVIITHKTFLESIEPLAEYRRSQGLTVKVVDIDEIYDEFSDGIFLPFAIQYFLKYAYETWQPPAPTYVLLVGDAHYDYKRVSVARHRDDPNSRGTYNLYPIFVPTYHGWAPASGETAMDQRFVNISGSDPLPDMLLGRLPVQTTDDLTPMIQKIIDYEQNPKIGPWQGTLVQVADNEVDNPNDELFEISRDEIIEHFIPVGYHTKQLYLRKIRSPKLTRSLIRQAINEGTLVIEYAGHGGKDTWADERIFHTSDVVSLRNRYLPFVVSTTCLNGKFDIPQQFGTHSLSEQFLLRKHGAIAMLTATRLTYANANAEFDQDLFTVMFTREPFEVKQGHLEIATKQPSIGKIITEAKIRSINRTGNRTWIPGTEQYTLFGDPATPLALPTLDIHVNLEDIALNSNKQIVVLNNEVGAYDTNQTWWKAEEFSTEKLIVSAIFHNNFDDEHGNEFVQSTSGRVWQGEFGTVRLNVPTKALSGKGVIHLFAYDDKRAAVGGTTFWVDTPILVDLRQEMDTIVNHTLTIQTLVLDDLGGDKGIRSVEVEWDDTFDLVDQVTPMIKIKPPSGTDKLPPGGQWYEIQTPIPLPPGGRQVRYRIVITDTNGIVVEHPSKTQRINVRVPAGPNINIGTDGTSLPAIRYIFDEATNSYSLLAEIINDGGRTVKTDIDVIFSEGNPDIEGDLILDEDVDILARTTIKPEDWKEGITALQHTIVIAPLKEALSTGVHKIYVLANPEVDLTDEISTGSVQEPAAHDNKQYITLVVNEFYYVPSEPLSAFSLDRVFQIDFPTSAIEVQGERIPLTISSAEPFALTQPTFQFAPIPRVAALRRGLLRTGEESAQQYEVSFRAADATLKKPATVKLRFDISGLEDRVRENTPWPEGSKYFKAVLIEEAEKLNIYTWHPTYEKWKRLPSQVNYATESGKPNPDDDGPIFQLENYVTPIQTENASKQTLPIENIKVDPYGTPAGTWVILFIDPTQYEVYLKRKNEVTVHKLNQIGQLDAPYREEIYGLEFTIPQQWETPTKLNDGTPILPFEFGDVFIFKTDQVEGSNATKVVETRNQNRGNGTAVVTARLGPKQEFVAGDWFLFFTSITHYEIRDKTGTPVYQSNDVLVEGVVNQNLFVNHLGFEVLVTGGSEYFRLGDKIKFSTAQVATITAQTTELLPFTLMNGNDKTPPAFKLWVDGIQPQRGSVIEPRPLISILLEDINGINLDTLIIRRGDNDEPLKPISDYVLRNPKNLNTVPIDYKPILFPGKYAFEIEARDFSGNAIGGDNEKIQTQFIVTEMPDITAPVIEFFVNDEVLVGEDANTNSLGDTANMGKNRITQQPHCEIQVTDETAIDGSLLSITFNRIDESDVTRRYREFDMAKWEFDIENPVTAKFAFAPDLPNGTYRLLATATDISENTTELEAIFTLEEAVIFKEKVFNVPNPVQDGKTFFVYQLTQPPDKVTIKIYTVSGRLIRTITDTNANRGNNETFWDGKDETGVRCANGVYLYRVIAHTGDSQVQKIGKLAILR